MKYFKNVIDFVGNTPLLEAQALKKALNLKANLYVKLEMFNPTGSVKDRLAKSMLLEGIKDGTIQPDSHIVEATSGNTGIGLASMGRSLGLKVSLVMPESMSIERRNLLKAYGANLILTPVALGMKGAIEKTLEMKAADEKIVIAAQFENPANVKIHYETTGPELYQQLDGAIDVLVAGIGTGGTITGAGKYLRERLNNLEIVAVEPDKSPVLSQGTAGPHGIQGIGAGFVPHILDTSIYDKVMAVSVDASLERARQFALIEGLGVGISSGAALEAAIVLAQQDQYLDKNVVVILPDSFDRYYSTDLFKFD